LRVRRLAITTILRAKGDLFPHAASSGRRDR
jgi:hypothetical protein